MPRLSLRMPNSSAIDSTDSYRNPTVSKASLHLPLQSPSPVSSNESSQSTVNSSPRMKLSQSNGHVNFQSFRKEDDDENVDGDDDDEEEDEVYLDAVDSLLPISPEDDLRKVYGNKSDGRGADTDNDVATATHAKNKDTTGASLAAGKVGEHKSYDNDEDDSLKMEVDDRFELSALSSGTAAVALPPPEPRHSTLKKVSAQSEVQDTAILRVLELLLDLDCNCISCLFLTYYSLSFPHTKQQQSSTDSTAAFDSSAKHQLNKRRLRFSVRTFSEGVDPEKAARKTVAFASDRETPSSVVFHPVPPPATLLQSSYRTDSLATIASLPTSSTPSNSKTRRQPVTNKTAATSDSFFLNFQQRRRRNSSNSNNTQTPVKNVQFPISLLKGSTATTEHSSTVQGKPPLRPSILKASSPFVAPGGHRKTCPRSKYTFLLLFVQQLLPKDALLSANI